MSLIDLIIVLVLAGFVLWLVSIAPFIEATMKKIIHGVVILFVILWLLAQLGFLDSLRAIRIGK